MLFVVPFKNSSKDEVINDLVLVKLARIILMIQLGAINKGLELVIKDLVPQGQENIEYYGLAEGNPLATSFKGRNGTKRRLEGQIIGEGNFCSRKSYFWGILVQQFGSHLIQSQARKSIYIQHITHSSFYSIETSNILVY